MRLQKSTREQSFTNHWTMVIHFHLTNHYPTPRNIPLGYQAMTCQRSQSLCAGVKFLAAEEMSHRFYSEKLSICICKYVYRFLKLFFSPTFSILTASRVPVAFLTFEVPSQAEPLNSTPAARQNLRGSMFEPMTPAIRFEQKQSAGEGTHGFFLGGGQVFEHSLLKPEKQGRNIPQPVCFF